MNAPALHALLIGIDRYMANELPGGVSYPHLTAAVRDVADVRAFLTEKLRVPEERITMLTASGAGAEPKEPRDRWPTYANIVRAIRALGEAASPGDVVHVHYSGHGGRTRTAFPELRGAGGVDEALVPTDIGTTESNYLRDVEMVYLIRDLADKGLLVSVILDACHSGGATRGKARAVARGTGKIDGAERAGESLVAPRKQLVERWKKVAGVTSDRPPGTWFPEPTDHVLLAACAPSELANELLCEDGEMHGALTHYMLKALEQAGPHLTYRSLLARMVPAIQSRLSAQTPLVLGPSDRVLFGADRIASETVGIPIIEAREAPAGVRLLLAAGQAQGITMGTQVAVFPPHVAGALPAPRCAVAKVVELLGSGVASWAEVSGEPRTDIPQGSQAVIIAPGDVRLVRRVVVMPAKEGNPPEVALAIEAMTEGLRAHAGRWFELVAPEEGGSVDYHVAVEDGVFEIWNANGLAVLLRPPVEVSDPKAVPEIAGRLDHLARFMNLRSLENQDSTSPLEGMLRATLSRGATGSSVPFESPHDVRIAEGEDVVLEIENRLPAIPGDPNVNVLYVDVLDLDSSWAVTSLVASRPVNAGRSERVQLQFSVPNGYLEGKETLKILASKKPTRLDWLTLPPLDVAPPPRPKGNTTRGTVDPLSALLDALSADRPASRSARVVLAPEAQWTTARIDVTVLPVAPVRKTP